MIGRDEAANCAEISAIEASNGTFGLRWHYIASYI